MDHSLQAAPWKIAFSAMRAYFITRLTLPSSGDMRSPGLASTRFAVLALGGSRPGAKIPV
jgi:hypothetical protein